MLINLSENNSIIPGIVSQLRDVEIQKDRLRFENNVIDLGMLSGYEISKLLKYKSHKTTTPLGSVNAPVLRDKVVIATILRAGLPLQNGVHKVFKNAELAFIGAARKPEDGKQVEIDLSYVASPVLSGKVLIIADTMLATGKSLVKSYDTLIRNHGKPKLTYMVSVLASQTGVDFVQKHIPNCSIFVCAIDPKLNSKFYIVPGLGDAGDLLYGPKL